MDHHRRPLERLPILLLLILAQAGIGLAGVSAAATPVAPGRNEAPAQGPDRRNTMRGIFNALIRLLPPSVDEELFAAPAQRADIQAALADLAENAAVIEQHGLGLNRSYRRAGAAMARDARDAREAFVDGDTRVARFIVRNLTENCFACHSRLPAGERAELAEEFAVALDLGTVPLEDRVRLLVATRQFEAAQQAAEALLQNPDLDPAAIDLMGTFEDYLKVCVRVDRNVARPRVALERMLQRDDLPVYLQLQLQEWVGALDELAELQTADLLTTSRELLQEARLRNLYLQDRRGLIHATLASGLLHLYIQSLPDADNPEVDQAEALSEAYYLLGLAESAISRTLWVPETEYFLETAVRLSPHSSRGREAFAFLEQYVIANYTGSAGTDIPDDVWDRLLELRELIEQ